MVYTLMSIALHNLSWQHKASAAAQVAAVSGDVRRALELCRKAAEIAEEQQHSSTAAGLPTGEPTLTTIIRLYCCVFLAQTRSRSDSL